jgi:hypothetical protein
MDGTKSPDKLQIQTTDHAEQGQTFPMKHTFERLAD